MRAINFVTACYAFVNYKYVRFHTTNHAGEAGCAVACAHQTFATWRTTLSSTSLARQQQRSHAQRPCLCDAG